MSKPRLNFVCATQGCACSKHYDKGLCEGCWKRRRHERRKARLNECFTTSCTKTIHKDGLCERHYVGHCLASGCSKPIYQCGYCRAHHAKFKRYGDPLEERLSKTMGSIAEYKVGSLLSSYGRKVERQTWASPFDLLVDGYRVEVKCAKPQVRRGSGIPQWQFNIHRHGILSEHADFYILRLEKVPFTKAAIHMLLRAPLGRLTVIISFRSLLNGQAIHVADFYSFAHGQLPEQKAALGVVA